jgi:hypothetical protein
MNMKNRSNRSYGQFSVGIFLLFVGTALIFNKFDLFVIGHVWNYWPLIIIAIGIGKLFDAQFAEEYRKAFWMLLLGCWFLISELHLFGFHYSNSWPILLVGAGITIVWKSMDRSNQEMKEHCHGI